MKAKFHSNGKLLLTGEYAVLDGALSLALPTARGQSMTVESSGTGRLFWESRDEAGLVWLKAGFHLPNLEITGAGKEVKILERLLVAARKLQPDFLSGKPGYKVVSSLEFPMGWGLGSSSTLVNNIAQWASVDPYPLLAETFGGSGYDIACARNNHPLLFQIEDATPKVIPCDFNPPFAASLYFVYLNKKQDSRDAIRAYRGQNIPLAPLVERISGLTREVIRCTALAEFEELMERHESILSQVLDIPPVKASLFPDFPGSVKSLGAWGGDFVLVTGDGAVPDYFHARGFPTVIPYGEMILRPES